jgi:Mg-chelatase subunit ChlD
LDLSIPVFPFTAIVGQEQMKQVLVLSLISPGIGGGSPEAMHYTRVVRSEGIESVLLDTEEDPCSFGYGPQIARAMGGHYIAAEQIVRRGVIELPI